MFNKRVWLSILIVNIMVIMFFGFWRGKKETAIKNHSQISEKLEILEAGQTPNFILPNIEGGEQNFHDVKAEIVLLHFWATWCAPCVIEYPSLIRLADSFKGKIKLVAVSSDEEKKDILRFLKKFGSGGDYTLHLWDNEGKVSTLFGTEKLPETYIFDSKFRLIRKIPNTEDWDSPRVRELFEFLLEQTEG